MRFLSIYEDLARGNVVCPRGQTVLELEDYMFTLGPRERFTSYKARKFNLDYAKFEFIWYLTGDRYNDSITKSASMWKELEQPDGGGWNSNYGQYWFNLGHMVDGGAGFDWVLDQLIRDKDSRQAVIPMLSSDHLFDGNKDVVCTYCVAFRIRDDELRMTVNMRSQDAIWGMTNDIFCFSVLHEMMYVALRDSKYPDLKMGAYTHKVDSLHVYEKHFDMLDQIIDDGVEGHYEIPCPKIYSFREVVNLMDYMAEDSRPEHRFTEWLYDNKYSDGLR